MRRESFHFLFIKYITLKSIYDFVVFEFRFIKMDQFQVLFIYFCLCFCFLNEIMLITHLLSSTQMVRKTFCFRAINWQQLESIAKKKKMKIFEGQSHMKIKLKLHTSGICASNSPRRPGLLGAVCCK